MAPTSTAVVTKAQLDQLLQKTSAMQDKANDALDLSSRFDAHYGALWTGMGAAAALLALSIAIIGGFALWAYRKAVKNAARKAAEQAAAETAELLREDAKKAFALVSSETRKQFDELIDTYKKNFADLEESFTKLVPEKSDEIRKEFHKMLESIDTRATESRNRIDEGRTAIYRQFHGVDPAAIARLESSGASRVDPLTGNPRIRPWDSTMQAEEKLRRDALSTRNPADGTIRSDNHL